MNKPTVQPSIERTELGSAASTPKLTNWTNEPTLQQLKADWETARQSHQAQMVKIDEWNALLKVEGKHRPKKVRGRSSVQPKLIRRQAEWRYSALTEPFLGSEKLFKISPATFEDVAAAEQNELILNHQFRTKMNRVKFIDDYVRSTTDEGTSVLQVGWKRVVVDTIEDAPVYEHQLIQDPKELEQFQQVIQMKMSDPHGYSDQPPEIQAAVDFFEETQQPTVAIQTGTQKVKGQKVMWNHPTVTVMNPRNVHIDPSCNGDIDKALFVGVSFETNKADLVKEGDRYKNLDKVNWEGNTVLSQPDHVTNTPVAFGMVDSSRKKVVAYEYWGFFPINGGDELVPFVCTWIGNVIVRLELNPFPDQKLPFIVVPYLPVKRELYGEPDAELLEDNQAILGAVTRGMIDLMGRSANGQQGFAKGMLDPLNRRRYENGQDYEFNPNTNPQQGLIEHKYPEIPQSAMAMLGLQNQEAEALTGVKSFGGGLSGESYGQVAAGIRGALDAASKREMAILRRLAKGISELGRKIIAMNQEFMSEEETVRITNEQFQTIKREDLQGEFDLIVDISTAEVDNAQAENLSFMLQTMGNTVDQSLTLMILAEIARLKRMPELAKKLKDFKPEPDPMQVKMHELEMKKLEKEIEEIQSTIDLNKAKAAESESKAESIDMNTTELASGTKHEHDLSKMAGQARGNQDLAVTKAILAPHKPGEGHPDVEAAVGYNDLTDRKHEVRAMPAPTNVAPAPTLPVDTVPQTNDQGMDDTGSSPMMDPSLQQ